MIPTMDQFRRILDMLRWWESEPRSRAPKGTWTPLRPIAVTEGMSTVSGTITASSTISLTAWNYTAQTYTGVVLGIVRNGMEPGVGGPGRLGAHVGANGTVNGTTCTLQPIGVGAEVLLYPDPTTPGGYMFSQSNWAE